MFRGIANLSVDAKGRIAVPKVHRERLEADGISDLMVTIDEDQCLLIYPVNEWQIVEKQLMALPNTDEYNRTLQRHYIGHATEVDLDGNGRILLPAPLRMYAAIDKKAVMLGQGNKLELWSEEVWAAVSGGHPTLLKERPVGERSEQVRNLSI